jgi:hypothetical protein
LPTPHKSITPLAGVEDADSDSTELAEVLSAIACWKGDSETISTATVAALIQNILENLIDGYDTDFISVASDRVDTRSPRDLVGAGLTRKSKRKMRSVNGVYGLGLTINPSLVLPDPL